MYNRLSAIPACDRQTGGRTDGRTDRHLATAYIFRAMHTHRVVKKFEVADVSHFKKSFSAILQQMIVRFQWNFAQGSRISMAIDGKGHAIINFKFRKHKMADGLDPCVFQIVKSPFYLRANLMKFAIKQQIWNSMTVTWPNMIFFKFKMAHDQYNTIQYKKTYKAPYVQKSYS